MINNEEKVKIIMDDLGLNYNEFLSQSKVKLWKQYKICPPESNRELMSDIVFSIVKKLETQENIDRYYKMVLVNTLKLYVFQAININTTYWNSPFLRKKIKENYRKNGIQAENLFAVSGKNGILADKMFVFMEELDDEKYIEYIKEKKVIDTIMDMLKQPNAERIFGEDWHYYTYIFLEYINTKSSYKSIALKYDIPLSSIAFHMRLVKDKIREELAKNKLNNE